MNIAKLLNPNIFLAAILVLFLMTRLYKIAEIPLSVYWDEASIGYNAYSIAQTGKDEWGEILPIHFRAFGEFKLPVYIYAVVPFVKLFGLNAFSVRLPAVLFSLGVVIIIYFLAKKLSESSKVGLISSFFIAISPWFFIFSRTGYEATAGLMFYLLAIVLILYKSEGKYLLFSVLSFILSAYSYNSFRIIVPLTILILIPFIKKAALPIIISSLLLLLVSIIPIYRLYTLDSGNQRFQTVGVTNAKSFFSNYLSHFSLNFLLGGDKNQRSQQAGFGQLYFPDLLFIPLGILYIIRSKSKIKTLPILFLLIASVPAALTKESPHALRAIAAVPFISMISAAGVAKMGKFATVVAVIVFSLFFVNYFVNFLSAYPIESAKDWQYDYKRIYIEDIKQIVNAKKVIVSDQYAQPYIFALFYLRYDPEEYRASVVRNSVDQWGFSTVKEFGKFEFGKFSETVSFNK